MVKNHLLVVEDDPAIQALIVAFLEQQDYLVTGASTGGEAQDKLDSNNIDLVVLDLGLPDEDGLVIARRLRARSSMPIIFVTQRGDRDTRLSALELGGDDYLTKPFDPRELAIRIRNILRRTQPANLEAEEKSKIIVGDLEIDLACRSVARGEKNISLTRGEFDLLAALVQARGRILSRDQLLDAISHHREDAGERIVDVLISRLRRKLEPGAKPWRIILTSAGLGYRLGVPVGQQQ